MHLNNYVMGLRPLEIFYLLQRMDISLVVRICRLQTSDSDVLSRPPRCNRLGASTEQKYSNTSTSTWKNDEYKYKYKYWILKSSWVQVQVLWKVLEYKYRVLMF